MFEPDITNVQQPVVDQTQFRVLYRRLHAAAAVVAANNDMFDFQHINRILHHGQTVQVGVDHQVGDVTVYKEFARFEARQTLSRNAAIGTSNPQKAWLLRLRQFLKKSGIFFQQHL